MGCLKLAYSKNEAALKVVYGGKFFDGKSCAGNNKTKYNGIELDEDLGLNVYEAQLRGFDPQIGRWLEIDPKTDEMYQWSTYASNFDNPIRYEDHLGDCPFCDFIRDAIVHFYSGLENLKAGANNQAASQAGENDNLPKPIQDIKNVQGNLQMNAGVLEMNQPALETIANIGLATVGVDAPGVGPLVTGSPVVKEVVGVATRANEINSVLSPFAQSKTTTAVARATTSEGNPLTLVASSENSLRPAQRAALQPGEVAVSGQGHAEQTILNHASANGMTVNQIAASRPICSTCAAAINNAGAQAASPLKVYKQVPATDSYVPKLFIPKIN